MTAPLLFYKSHWLGGGNDRDLSVRNTFLIELESHEIKNKPLNVLIHYLLYLTDGWMGKDVCLKLNLCQQKAYGLWMSQKVLCYFSKENALCEIKLWQCNP